MPQPVTEQVLARTIEAIYERMPEAMLVGSLGRAAYLGDTEFLARSEPPLYRIKDKQPRDIDLLVPELPDAGMFDDLEPFKVDVACYRRPEIYIGRVGSAWVLQSEMYDLKPTILEDEVLNPNQLTTVYGIDCLVPPIATLHRLAGVPKARPKDKVARKLLEQEMGTVSQAEEYESLDYLFDIAQHRALDMLSGFYGNLVPRDLRMKIRPALLPTRRALIALSAKWSNYERRK